MFFSLWIICSLFLIVQMFLLFLATSSDLLEDVRGRVFAMNRTKGKVVFIFVVANLLYQCLVSYRSFSRVGLCLLFFLCDHLQLGGA